MGIGANPLAPIPISMQVKDARLPGFSEDQAFQVPRVVGRHTQALSSQDDGVRVAEPSEAGNVESRLDGEGHPFPNNHLLVKPNVWLLVRGDTHTMSGAVDGVLTEPGPLDDPSGRRIHLPHGYPRLDGLHG